MSNLALLQALVFEPRRAFTDLDARPRFWWAMMIVVLSSAVLAVWYTAVVDLEWATDQQLRGSTFTQNMTDAEIARMAAAAGERRGVQMVVGALSTGVVVAVLILLFALYYSLAGKVTGMERSFRHWMALSAWSSMPSVLAVIPAALVLLTAGSPQILQTDLQPLSLNALFLDREPGEPGFTLLSTLNLFQLVALYLAAFGVKVWSGRSWLYSLVFTALPLVLIFGIWALIAF